jgi:hypothetical protein
MKSGVLLHPSPFILHPSPFILTNWKSSQGFGYYPALTGSSLPREQVEK